MLEHSNSPINVVDGEVTVRVDATYLLNSGGVADMSLIIKLSDSSWDLLHSIRFV